MPTIEVFADVTCPFTHVGLHRLVERRTALGRDDVRLLVRAWPLELVNGTGLDPCAVATKVGALRASVGPDLFGGFDPATFPPTTLPALDLAAQAYRRGLVVGEQVSLRLRDAVFEEGHDVSDPGVLAEIAEGARVPHPAEGVRHQVIADWREGVERHVVGSPHFFVGDQDWFCPSLRIAHVDGDLQIDRDIEEFERFVGACFAC
jgi:2-hydroxychromene-2-carboxylate isomerase